MGQADDAIAYARAQIGKPYKWAHTGPDAFDCSGLIYAAYRAANPPVTLVPFTGTMLTEGAEVARADLQPGDLVFPDFGHVQLFTGNNTIIEAPHEGAYVQERTMYGFWRARRVTTDGAISLGGRIGRGIGALNPPSLPDPVAVVTGAEQFTTVGTKLVANVVSPIFWKRVGYFVLAGVVILISILFLSRHKVAAGAGYIVDHAAGIANTAADLAIKKKLGG